MNLFPFEFVHTYRDYLENQLAFYVISKTETNACMNPVFPAEAVKLFDDSKTTGESNA